MARSFRLTCLKIEGNSLSNKVSRPTWDFFSAYNPELRQT